MKHFNAATLSGPDALYPRSAMPRQAPPAPVVTAQFDPDEARSYGGVKAAELIDMAQDHDSFEAKTIRPGAVQRLVDASLEKLDALRAYMIVKTALRRLFAPLMPKPTQQTALIKKQPSARKVQPTYVWTNYKPRPSDWAELDAYYGYDVRGTSPTWIAKRADMARRKLQAEINATVHADVKPGIDPAAFTDVAPCAPQPRNYEDADDLHMIWPPIELPSVTAAELEEASSPSSTLPTPHADCKPARLSAIDAPDAPLGLPAPHLQMPLPAATSATHAKTPVRAQDRFDQQTLDQGQTPKLNRGQRRAQQRDEKRAKKLAQKRQASRACQTATSRAPP